MISITNISTHPEIAVAVEVEQTLVVMITIQILQIEDSFKMWTII
jgi:hypothetical protein